MNRRRVVLRTMAAACVAVAVATVLGGTASADAPDKYAWWWKPKQNASLTFVPAPPNVDTTDFYVANDATGPLAVGAVHFQVLGSGDGTLTLRAKDQSTFTAADIAACPATSVWDGVFAGSWEQKPTWNADACVKGAAGSDGATMTWKIGSAFTPADGTEGEYSVVLVPQGNVPFSVVVRQPDDSAFTGFTAGAPGGGFTESGAGSAAGADSGFSPAGDTGGSFGAADLGGSSGSFDMPAASTDAGAGAAPAPATGGGAPTVAAGGGAGQPGALPVQTALASAGGDTGERVASAVLLGLIAAALWWLGGVRQPAPLPALAHAPARVGGIGRFARPRSAPPNRL